LTGPEAASSTAPATGPIPGSGPLPSPAAGDTAIADHAAAPGPFTLETTLLGPLTVPNGAARAVEIEELSRRAYRAAWRQCGLVHRARPRAARRRS